MDQRDKLEADRHTNVAARISAAFAAKGFKVILHGGATVEHYTQGGYATGDIDLGFIDKAPPLEVRTEVMQGFGCERGIRQFKVEGVFVDLLGVAEILGRNTTEIGTPFGSLTLESPEESLVQRAFNSIYLGFHEDQKQAAVLLIAQALMKNIPMDWAEVERLAQLPVFKVTDQIAQYRKEAEAALELEPMPYPSVNRPG